MKNYGNPRPILRVTLSVCALMMATVAAAAVQPGTWTARADLPERLYFAATAEVDGIIYVFGGSPSMDVVDTVFAYDPVSDLWSEMNPMPTARSVATAAAVNGRIYVFGGTTDLNVGTVTAAVEMYDPATDSWESRSDMPTALWGPAAVAVDGKIYVIGGGTDDVLGVFTPHSTVQIFDPAADSWTTGAPLQVPRATIAAAVWDGWIFAVGGAEENSASKAFEIYDPTSDTWYPGPDMPTARDWHAAAVVGDKVYAIGGLAWGQFIEQDIVRPVDVFNNRTLQWEQPTQMPDPRFGLSAAVLDDTVHLIGGANRLMLQATRNTDSYDHDLYTYWTEAAAHLSGSHGSQWRTDICVANLNGATANVELLLHTETGTHGHSDTIGPTQQKAFPDVVGEMGISGKGLLQVGSDRVLKIAGRTFNDSGDGTFGQSCGFKTMDDGFARGDTEVYLIGLHQEAGLFRTNMVFANTGIRQATMYVTLYNCSGDVLTTFPVTLAPGQMDQYVEPFVTHGNEPNLGWGYARIMVIDGAGVLISASVIDSNSNDATTIPAEK